jgi:hypothetical protein
MIRPALTSLYHYPIKGLSPQPLDRAELAAGSYFPHDRLYAIENGPSGFDAANPVHLPKFKFLMLMRNERLAELKTHYDPATHRLTIDLHGEQVCDADLSTSQGRAEVETFFADFSRDDLQGPPKLLAWRADFRFTDSPKGFVSLVNLASVSAIEAAVGRPVDPLRFRANLYFDGASAWAEHDFIGRRLNIGEAVLEVTRTTERCAATGVDPQTGRRDMNLVKTLMQSFDHNLCGVYARVIEGGRMQPGDKLNLLD